MPSGDDEDETQAIINKLEGENTLKESEIKNLKSEMVKIQTSYKEQAYSKTQANIALSSAEAEYYGMVKAASEGLGLKAMTEDFESKTDPWMFVDATAAMGVSQRIGLGKLRHLDTQSLWLQEAIRIEKLIKPERKSKGAGSKKKKGAWHPLFFRLLPGFPPAQPASLYSI